MHQDYNVLRTLYLGWKVVVAFLGSCKMECLSQALFPPSLQGVHAVSIFCKSATHLCNFQDH